MALIRKGLHVLMKPLFLIEKMDCCQIRSIQQHRILFAMKKSGFHPKRVPENRTGEFISVLQLSPLENDDLKLKGICPHVCWLSFIWLPGVKL